MGMGFFGLKFSGQGVGTYLRSIAWPGSADPVSFGGGRAICAQARPASLVGHLLAMPKGADEAPGLDLQPRDFDFS